MVLERGGRQLALREEKMVQAGGHVRSSNLLGVSIGWVSRADEFLLLSMMRVSILDHISRTLFGAGFKVGG